MITAAALTALTAFLTYRVAKEPKGLAQPTQFVVLPPEGGTFSGDGIAGSNPPSPQLAIAPDGRRMAFIAVLADGRPRVWVRSRDSVIAHPLAGTDGAAHPFWSRDAKYIGFFAGAKLKTILADGGPVQVLCDAVNPRGGTWNADGVIIFAAGFGDGLQRVSVAGGPPATLTAIDAAHDEISHRWPQFLPDGRHFLYLALSAKRGHAGIHVGALDSKETVRVLDTDFHAEFTEPGYLLFVREGGLLAQRFDPKTLHLSGEAIPIADHVGSGQSTGESAFSVSPQALLYTSSIDPPVTRLTWTDRTGRVLEQIGSAGRLESPDVSPDGQHVAAHRTDPVSGIDIWLMDGTRAGAPSRFTFDPAVISRRCGRPMAERSLSARTAPERSGSTPNGSVQAATTCWSSRRRMGCCPLAGHPMASSCSTRNPARRPDLISGCFRSPTAHPRRLNSTANETQGQLSADGRLLAYMSDETGVPEVYVQPFPPTGAKWQISTSGGSDPQWRRDGRELFYITLDGKLTAAQVTGGAMAFDVVARQVLFQTPRPTARGPNFSATTNLPPTDSVFCSTRSPTTRRRFRYLRRLTGQRC